MRTIIIVILLVFSKLLAAAQIPELGIQVQIVAKKGLEIVSLHNGHWAAKAELQLGDIITKYQLLPNSAATDIGVNAERQARLLMAQLRVIKMSQSKQDPAQRQAIRLHIQRGNDVFVVSGDLISGPQQAEAKNMPPADKTPKPRLGVIVISAAVEDGGGAVVLEVLPDSVGAEIGLQAGHIIRVFECGDNYVEVKNKLDLVQAVLGSPFDEEFFIDAYNARNTKLEFRGTFKKPIPKPSEEPVAKQVPEQQIKTTHDDTKDDTDSATSHLATVTSFRAGDPNVIMINAGSNAGLSKGQLVYIVRGDTYLCQARLVKVAADKAMAHNVLQDWEEGTQIRQLKAGDGVKLEP